MDERAEGWKKYGFNLLFQTVLEVRELEAATKVRVTATAAKLIRVLQLERDRIERIDEWNRKKTKPT